MSIEPVIITESDLRERWGLSKKALAGIRYHQLTENAHWKKEGREIGYTAAGVDALEALLAVQQKDGAETSTVPAPLEATALVIVKTNFLNPRLVLAKKKEAPDPPEILRVFVKNKTHLRPSMVLNQCFPKDEAAGLWEFRGKLPRHPGKW